MSYSPVKIFARVSGKSLFLSIFMFAVLIIQPPTLTASTHVSGRISEDTVWSLKNHPYIVDSTVTIYGDSPDHVVTLTIEPGVEIRFNNNTYLQVGTPSWKQKGCIIAAASSEKPIMFTAVSQKPGAWRGIYFADGTVDNKSTLNHCTVQYGGSRFDGNIYIESCSPIIANCAIQESSKHGIRISNHEHSNPRITGCIITGNAANGIHCDRNQPTPVISGNTIRKNKGHAIAASARALDRIDANNRITGNGKNSIYVWGDRIKGNHTWKVRVPCIISGDVEVAADRDEEPASLELLPGAVLYFDSGKQLRVGSKWRYKGILIAKGIPENPITFTALSPKPGAWRGIYFADGTVDGKSILNHCIVQYGGNRFDGNIYIETCSPIIANCTIQNSSKHGIRMNNHEHSRPQIKNNSIEDNAGDGIHTAGSEAAPVISANTIRNNNGHPIKISARAVNGIDENNRIINNGKNSVYVWGDLIKGNHRWKVKVPYIISANVDVYGDRGKEPASLELLPGAVLYFAKNAHLRIGAGWRNKGILTAKGTPDNPITFTAVSQNPGGWHGIYFSDGAVDHKNILRHCLVEYGGNRQNGNIYIETCSPIIADCTIQKGSKHGIRINNHEHSKPQITGSIITGNAENGIYCDRNQPTPLISANTINENKGYAIVIGAHAVTGIDENNRVQDNGKNSIYVWGERLKGNHRWKVKVPYIISGNVDVYGDRGEEPASLELLPGAVLHFGDRTQLRVGSSWRHKGILTAKGTPGDPVTFTGVSQKPGAWHGIYFSDGAVDGKNILAHCIVEYGGGRFPGNIYIEHSSATIANSIIRKSASYGIYSKNSLTGVYCSNILDNATGGIYHKGKGSVSAEYVWWGDPSGPSGSGTGKGSSITTSVDFDPWLTQPIDADPDFYIRNITVSPGIFSNRGGSAHFQVLFSSPAQWKIIISDPDNQPIKETKGTGPFIDWQWPGNDNQGIALKNGKYKFVLEGKGNRIVTGFVEIRDTVPLAEITFPDFSRIVLADTDIHVKGIAKEQDFKSYTLEYGQGCHPAAWTVLQESTNPVDNAALSKKPFHIPAEKNYMGVLRLRVQNNANEQTIVKQYIDIMEMETISAQNQFFSPNNDHIKDQTIINAHLNFSNPWQLKITGSQKKKSRKSRKSRKSVTLPLLRTFTGFGRIISQSWDGKDEQGNVVPDGPYRYEVSVLHPVSGKAVLVKETLGTVDTVRPSLEISSPVPGGIIADTHTVRGTAADNHLSGWQIDLGAGETPEKWEQIYESEQGVSNGTLMKLDTRNFKHVVNTLRLQSRDRAGNHTSLRCTVKVFNLMGAVGTYLFSPNNDGNVDVAPLDNALTLAGDWEITIANIKTPGNILRKYIGSGQSLRQDWDGKTGAGQTASDGIYIARVTAVPVGQQAPRTTRDLARVTVDNTSPRLVFHHPVKGGDLYNAAPLRITVDEANLINYSLYHSEKNFPDVFKKLHEGKEPVQNAVVYSWDTYKFPNGKYNMRLTAVDRAMNRKVLTIPARIDNIIISSVSNTPVFFDPLKGEKTDIKYEIDRDAYITIDMLHRDPVHGKILAVKATPYREAKRKKGKNSDPWDGKGDDGNVLPLTYYPYRITAKKDERLRVYETSFITGAFEPSTSGAAFMVEIAGMTLTTGGLDIIYKLEKNTRIDIQVGEHGKEEYLHYLMRDAPLPAGEHTSFWDLRNNQGKLVRPQKEAFELSIGVKGIPLPDAIAVTRSKGPGVKNILVDNLLIQPNYDETAYLHYTLEENVERVILDIIDPNGNHFRSLKGDVDAGSHKITWDGRDDTGRLAVVQGDYRFSLKVSRAGEKDIIRKGAFVLKGDYKWDENGRYESPELFIIEVRDDKGKLIGIETREKGKK